MFDLPNEELRPGQVPESDAAWYPTIVDFALSFDGYEAMGSFNRLSKYARRWFQRWKDDGSLPRDLIHLRSCLFMVQRAVRWAEYSPDSRPTASRLRCWRRQTPTAMSGRWPGSWPSWRRTSIGPRWSQSARWRWCSP